MLNAAIRDIALPARMKHLPVNDRGFPVPWFVPKVKGEWDFRAVDAPKVIMAYRRRLCWLCGAPLGRFLAFVIGPMCSINRVSSEPPSHRDCAEYAVRACPFLSRPRARRNTVDTPAGVTLGIHLDHNPGATLIWITRSYRPISDGRGGRLFEIGEPVETLWYCEGRIATREEIMAAIEKGLPYLREVAATQDGPEGERELQRMIEAAMKLVPA
jgi:hypothetical protein